MKGLVEQHSIDYIPEHERHGKSWHQAPFWFAGNFILPTLLTGYVGPALGLSLGWTLLAIGIGLVVGTSFVALHANQGPRLGLPQMIQSRAQFGAKGAIIPFLIAIFIYIGFCVFNIVAAAGALDVIWSAGNTLWIVLSFAVALGLAFVGHDLLHVVQRWVTYCLAALFAVLTIYALGHLHPVTGAAAGHFTAAAFMAEVLAAASFQLSYAVFVSDYTRYLPSQVSAPKLIAWTYLGMALSSAWLMALAAFFAASLPAKDISNAVAAIQAVGNSLTPGFGTFLVLVSTPALISITAVELYGTMLCGVSSVAAFRKVSFTVKTRLAGILLATLVAIALTLALPSNYLGSFSAFLSMLIDFLGPWTAVNLVDFYLIQRGRYSSKDILDAAGPYGGWMPRGAVSYLVSLAAGAPFWSFSFFTGPGARALGGVDVSFLVGIAVSGSLYWLLSQSSRAAGGGTPVPAIISPHQVRLDTDARLEGA